MFYNLVPAAYTSGLIMPVRSGCFFYVVVVVWVPNLRLSMCIQNLDWPKVGACWILQLETSRLPFAPCGTRAADVIAPVCAASAVGACMFLMLEGV
jgi:hypothetical protein